MILLCSRASTEGGRETRRAAVQGIYTAALRLAELGCDIRHLLPDEADLLGRVAAGASRDPRPRRGGGGRRFTTHSYVYADQLDQGLVLLVQYGSGSLLDENFSQPSIETVGRQVAVFAPVLLAVNEVRAWGRTGPGLVPLLFECRRLHEERGEYVWISDAVRSMRPLTPQVEQELVDAGFQAEQEAADGERRRSDALELRTPGGTVQGAFRIGAIGSLPPPMATARLRGPGGTGDRHAFLDTPGARPKSDRVVSGLPEVYQPRSRRRRAPPVGRDKAGRRRRRKSKPARRRPVDQLRLVRWFYAHFLTGRWTVTATAEYLAAHRFSTEGYRRQKGRAASVRLRSGRRHSGDASKICASIWRHRRFHLTGVLPVKRGTRGMVTYTVLTPDGEPIATAEQVRRIELAKGEQSSLRPRPKVLLLTGLHVRHNGKPTVLTPEHRHGGELRWVFQTVGPRRPPVGPPGQRKRPGRRRRRPPGVPLPHSVFVSAVYRAAKKHDLVPVLPVQDAGERDRLDAAVVTAAREVQEAWEAHKRAERMVAAVIEADVFDAEAAAVANRTLIEFRRAKERAETRLRLAEVDLRAFDHPAQPEAAALAGFLDLAAGIRDPFDARLRGLLRASIVDFTATSTRTGTVGDLRHGTLEFSFRLRMLDAEGQLWELPVHGRHDAGGARDLGARVYAAIVAMHAGIPPAQFFGTGWREWAPWLRAALTGDPRAPCVLLNVQDPWLLAVGMALLHPLRPEPDWTAAAVKVPTAPDAMPVLVDPPLTRAQRSRRARDLGVPPTFLHRLADQYANPGTTIGVWLGCAAPRLAAAIAAARTGTLTPDRLPRIRGTRDGIAIFEVDGGRVRLTGCPGCGCRDRILLRLREPVGLVCMRCRLDDAGVWWPADPYDWYQQQPAAAA